MAMDAMAVDARQSFGLVRVKTDLIQLQMRLVTTGASGQNISSAVSSRIGDVVQRGIICMLVTAAMTVTTQNSLVIVRGALQRDRHVFVTVQAFLRGRHAGRQAASPYHQD